MFTTTNEHTEFKHTLLTIAFNCADLKVADFLIKVGADIKAVGEGGLTPLIIAIEKECDDPKHKELVDLLMKANADVNAAGADGMTPLSKAVERGDLVTFKALMEKGLMLTYRYMECLLLKWAEEHQSDSKIKKQDMKKIINVLKAPSKEKRQNGAKSTGGQTTVNGGNKTPEKNDTNFWSEHKGKIALSIVRLCTAGYVAAYVLAYPVVALALAVLEAVLLMGAGIAKVHEKVENTSVEKPFTQKEKAA